MALYPTVDWIRQSPLFNTARDDTLDNTSFKCASDASGNFYFVYRTFGGGVASGQISPGASDGRDLVLVKMDSNGNTLYVKQTAISGAANEVNPSIAVDSNGNIYISCITSGTLSGRTEVAGGNNELAIIKLDTDGNVLWIKQDNTITPTNGGAEHSSIAVDNTGFVYIGIHIGGAISGGTYFAGNDIALMKLSADTGARQWLTSGNMISSPVGEDTPNIAVVNQSLYLLYRSSNTSSILGGAAVVGSNDLVLSKFNISDGSRVWIQTGPALSTTAGDNDQSIAVDQNENVYVSYSAGAAISGGTAIGSADAIVVKFDSNGNRLWAHQNASTSTSANDAFGPRIAVDYDGDVYISYRTDSGISGDAGDFDPVSGRFVRAFQRGNGDIVVAKLAGTDGTRIWATQKTIYNTTGTETYPFISIVPGTKTVRVLYQTNGAVTGGTNLQRPLPDAIMCQFDSTGTRTAVLQGPTFNTSGTESSIVTRLDSAGNMYVAYITTGGAVSGGGTTSNSDVVIAKFNSSRVLQWARQNNTISTPQTENQLTIAVDASQNVFVAYASTGTVSGGVGNLGSTDIIFIKLNSSGTRLWTMTAAQNALVNTSVGQDRPQLETDPSGNVYMAYRSAGAVTGGFATGSADIVVAKFDTNGNRTWVRQDNTINTTTEDGATDRGPRIAVDASGNVFLTYTTSNGTISGGGPMMAWADSVVIKLNSSGAREWAIQNNLINTWGWNAPSTICLDPSGNVYLTAAVQNAVTGGTFTGPGSITTDVVVVKIDTTGARQWIIQNSTLNTNVTDSNPEIVSDTTGNVYVAYRTVGTTSGNTRPTTSDYLSREVDLVIAKISWAGVIQWVKQNGTFNTTEAETWQSIAVSGDGSRIFLAFQGFPLDGGAATMANSSDMVALQMTEQTLPTQPYNLSVSNVSSSSVTLQWTIDSLGTAPLDGYYMFMDRKIATRGSAPIPSNFIPIANVTSLGSNQYSTTVTLSGHGEYTVSIWASTGFAPSPTSASVSFFTNTVEPSVPQNLSASGKDGTLYLTWDHPAAGLATSYIVTLTGGITRTVTTPFTSFTGLVSGTAYTATVKAANSAFPSGAAATASTTYTIPVTPLSAPIIEWVSQDLTLNTNQNDQTSPGAMNGIHTDSSGNIYITYSTGGVVSGEVAGAGWSDVVIAKISPTGERLWAIQRAISSNNTDSNCSIAVDSSNNIIIAYTTNNTGVISGGTALGGSDMIIVKVDSNGNVLWTKQDNTINTSGSEADISMVTDRENSIYISYNTTGTVSGGILNRGQNDTVILKLDSNGNRVFMKQDYEINDGNYQSSANICVDDSLNIYLLQRNNSTVSGGTAALGSDDMILMKYDQYGRRLWVANNTLTSTTAQEYARQSMVVDKGGNIYIVYETNGGVISGGSTPSGGTDLILQKFDTNGNRIWINNSNVINTNTTDRHQNIDIDEDGNVYLVYSTAGNVAGLEASKGSYDIVVTKFDTNGSRVWSINNNRINSNTIDECSFIAVHSQNQIYIVFRTSGAVSGMTNGGGGQQDVVVARIGQYFAPDVPTSIAATPGDSSVSLTFTTPSSDGGRAITNYKYSLDGGATFTAFSPAITSSPAVITGLTNGQTYNIQLEAVNEIGDGLNSATFTVTPRTIPQAPSDLVATPGNQSVSVAFVAPSDGGSAITNYKYSINGGSTFTAFSPAQTASPAVIAGLTNGTSYTIQLLAVNAAGDGPASSQVAATPVTAPGMPAGLSATPGNQTISIAFTAPNDGGSPITNYEYSLDGGSLYVLFSPAQTSSPVTISNLTNGTSYNIKLRAVNAVDSGAASSSVIVTPRTTPSAPTSLEATVGDSFVSIAFVAPSTGGSPITNYMYSIDGGSTFAAFSPAQTASPVPITGLTNGQSYTFKLKAVNAAGEGLTSAQVTATPVTNPSAPTSLVATPGNGQVSIAFTEPASNGGSPIINYKLSTDGGATFTALSPAQTTSPISIGSLTNGRTYQIQLKAVTAVGESQASSQVSAMPVTGSQPDPATIQGLLSHPSDFKSYLTSFSSLTIPSVSIDSVNVTSLVTASAPSFNTSATYKTNFIVSTGSGQEISTSSISTGELVYVPSTSGTVFSLTVDDILYVIITYTSSIAINSVTYNVGQTVVLGNKTFLVAFVGSVGLLAIDGNDDTNTYVPCIVEGQSVLTPDGYCKVEALKQGDHIVTAEGHTVPVKIYKTVIKQTTKENAPICITMNDTTIKLSPHHAYKVNTNGWMLPNVALTAGFPGVEQQPLGERVVYYHLETPNYLRDDIVLEGCVVESYGRNFIKTNTINMRELYVKSKHGEWYERMKQTARSRNVPK
jgi:hypothetical protein